MKEQLALATGKIDFLTLTYAKDELASKLAYDFATGYRERAKSEGFDEKPWSMVGFKGIRVRELRMGTNQNNGRNIVQLTGKAADDHAHELVGVGGKPTRVDLAVTTRLAFPDKQLAQKEHKRLYKDGLRDGKQNHNPIYMSSEYGDTLYLGNRRNEVFMRLYDRCKSMGLKRDETGQYWRYEVEYKGKRAKPMAEAIVESEGRHAAIMGVVHDQFTKWGVEPVFDRGLAQTTIEVGYRVTDDQRRLQWLRQTVSPVVAQLRLKLGDGDVFDALNVSNYYTRDMEAI